MHKYLLESGAPLPVAGRVQEYAWGKVGTTSRIAGFLRGEVPSVPLAEYWLGCHPKGPAEVILPDGTRCSLLDILPGIEALPFMVKVLSINPDFGLSIQSHPDIALAQNLHASDPQHYPDPFHKPEVGVALTPVRLLYDIKPASALCEAMKAYPEVLGLLSDGTCAAVQAYDGGGGDSATAVRRGVFADCITAEADAVRGVIEAILNRQIGMGAKAEPEEVLLVRRLAKTHGLGDVGLVALLIMNIVHLEPGEGIFISANVPHAYLDGDLVECMACSDNVIRAGLTSKFRDVETLVTTTKYASRNGPYGAAKRELSSHYTEFVLPVREFRLGVIHAGARDVPVDLREGHALALCIGGQAHISSGAMKASVTLGDGGAVLLPKGQSGCRVSTDSGQVFIACAGGTL